MRTNYRIDGPPHAPVVTLVHPLGATLELWDATVAALRDRHRVVRYDVRGHGGSDVPPGPYTLSQMVGDLGDLLESLGVGQTHLVGLSMGGLIGMQTAIERPGLVDRLVLCDTTACYGNAMQPMWNDRIRMAETAGMTETLIDRTMDIWFSPDFQRRDAPAVDRVRAMLRATDPRGYAAAIRAIGFVDLREAIRTITAPTLVVVGEDDPGTTPAMAEVIRDAIAGSRLLLLPGARHCSVIERAPDFNRALDAFLG